MVTCMFSHITHLSAKETKVQRTHMSCPRLNRWQVQKDYELGLFALMYHIISFFPTLCHSRYSHISSLPNVKSLLNDVIWNLPQLKWHSNLLSIITIIPLKLNLFQYPKTFTQLCAGRKKILCYSRSWVKYI